MTDTQTSAPESSGGLNDLASFLADTPDSLEPTEQDEEQTLADDSTADGDTEAEANDEQDIDPDAPDAEEEEPAPVEKITFKVKNDDGVEETVEATTEEIAKSYMRQATFTRKTQELAARENEAVQLLAKKHEEIRSQYLSQAELTRAAIVNMAGIKSEDELAQLANSDPAAWVAEQQRQRQISNYLNQLDQQINGEKQQAEAQRAEQMQKHLQVQYQKAWNELSKDGIDKPKLQKIYTDTSKNYGYTNEELANVYDSRLVRMMKDAAAYRELQEQRSKVTKQVQSAPRMPSRQAQPANDRRDQALESRFKGGRAKLNDLAAFLR